MAETTEKKKGGDGSTLAAVLEQKSERIAYEVAEEERLPGSRVRFKLKLSEEAIAGRLGETLKEFSRQVRIPGFRPGKAPQNIVRKAYEPAAREETVKRLVPRLAELFAEEKGLETLSQPYLLSWKSEKEAGTTVEVAIEIHPEIAISEETFGALAVQVHSIKVDDDYVNRNLEGLRAQNATYEPTEEGFQAKDGLLFTCVVSDANGSTLAERSVKEYYTTKADEEIPEEVVAALVGKKKGDHLSMDIEEDSDLVPGTREKVHYELDVLEVKRRMLPELDDDFAMDVNEDYKTLDDLKNAVRENARVSEENRQREEALGEVYNLLRDRLEFDLPRALVESTANRSISDMERRLNQYGMSLRTMDQDLVRNYALSMQEQARLNVKNYLIARAIGKFMSVTPTDEEIQTALERVAKQSGRKALAVRAQLEARKQWDQFIEDLTIKVTNDRVIEKAAIEKREVTASEFEEIQHKRQEEQAAKLRGEAAIAAATEQASREE